MLATDKPSVRAFVGAMMYTKLSMHPVDYCTYSCLYAEVEVEHPQC